MWYPYYGVVVGGDSDALGVAVYDKNGNITWGGTYSWVNGSNVRKNNSLGTSTSNMTIAQEHRIGSTSYTSNMPPYLSVYMWQRTA